MELTRLERKQPALHIFNLNGPRIARMKSMTPDEWREFLLFGTRTAKVATVRPNGSPHVAPVWFVLDGNELVFTTNKNSVKEKNLLRDPHVMVSTDDEKPPFSFVLVDGAAIARRSFCRGPLALRADTSRRVKRRLMENVMRSGGELLVLVPLTKVIAQKGIAEW